jgi:hypothetical protein
MSRRSAAEDLEARLHLEGVQRSASSTMLLPWPPLPTLAEAVPPPPPPASWERPPSLSAQMVGLMPAPAPAQADQDARGNDGPAAPAGEA